MLEPFVSFLIGGDDLGMASFGTFDVSGGLNPNGGMARDSPLNKKIRYSNFSPNGNTGPMKYMFYEFLDLIL